ncbi:hypothetical protein FOA52_013439 [Chlamydomonas sp. UWO 241]|nr:hypothetical protein FOA52_013439 [Chlamydomonas sp. UWO 241]
MLPPPPKNYGSSMEALAYCKKFEGNLFDGIDSDLSAWPNGIERAAMSASIMKFTTRGKNKGIALAFRGGVAYVVEAQLVGPVGHHATIYFQYMEVMVELQRLFGKLIPDVEFVIASSDRPMVSRNATPAERLPVFRFCGSPVHADIQIPIFHFYSKRYTQSSLAPIPQINQENPWEGKQEVLFGRFSNYLRYFDPGADLFQRRGTGNKTICKQDDVSTMACRVRQHFIAWSKRHPDVLDVDSSPKVPMERHARWKYLLHLDGQALSSRLDLLLPLNSLIFKEQSGYTSFYHHLLVPHTHFIPVWKQTPDDVLEAIQWAKTHDAEAKKIAANAQAFAIKYLDKRARTCYWFRLLTSFAKLLRYEVDPRHEVGEYEEWSRARNDRLNKWRLPRPPPAPPRPPPGPPIDSNKTTAAAEGRDEEAAAAGAAPGARARGGERARVEARQALEGDATGATESAAAGEDEAEAAEAAPDARGGERARADVPEGAPAVSGNVAGATEEEEGEEEEEEEEEAPSAGDSNRARADARRRAWRALLREDAAPDPSGPGEGSSPDGPDGERARAEARRRARRALSSGAPPGRGLLDEGPSGDAGTPQGFDDAARADWRERADPRIAEFDVRMKGLGKWRTVEEYLSVVPHEFDRGKRRTSSKVEEYDFSLGAG